MNKSRIFISYRRSGEKFATQNILCDGLQEHFKSAVFIDIHGIRGGENFKEKLAKVLKECEVMLVVMHKGWVQTFNDYASEKDYVLYEITTALKREIPIIPILIDEAKFPQEDELPASIRAMSPQNALPLRSGRDAKNDLKEIVEAIHYHLPDFKENQHFVVDKITKIIEDPLFHPFIIRRLTNNFENKFEEIIEQESLPLNLFLKSRDKDTLANVVDLLHATRSEFVVDLKLQNASNLEEKITQGQESFYDLLGWLLPTSLSMRVLLSVVRKNQQDYQNLTDEQLTNLAFKSVSKTFTFRLPEVGIEQAIGEMVVAFLTKRNANISLASKGKTEKGKPVRVFESPTVMAFVEEKGSSEDMRYNIVKNLWEAYNEDLMDHEYEFDLDEMIEELKLDMETESSSPNEVHCLLEVKEKVDENFYMDEALVEKLSEDLPDLFIFQINIGKDKDVQNLKVSHGEYFESVMPKVLRKVSRFYTKDPFVCKKTDES